MSIDLESGQRTYFLGLSATAVTTTSNIPVPFKDTAGNVIKCNYFKVDLTSNSPSNPALVVAELSGVSVTQSMLGTSAIYNVTALPTSGIIGVGTVVGGGGGVGSCEWHGTNGDVCTGINLKFVAQNGTILAGITYGNLLGYNALRSSSYDKGI